MSFEGKLQYILGRRNLNFLLLVALFKIEPRQTLLWGGAIAKWSLSIHH